MKSQISMLFGVFLLQAVGCAGSDAQETSLGDASDANSVDTASQSLQSSARKGMTWTSAGPASMEIEGVGCIDCQPYQGDTSCSTALPLLCIKPEQLTRPNYEVKQWSSSQALSNEYYRGWSGGRIKVTQPILGSSLTSQAAADAVCAREAGAGYRWAEFHDGEFAQGMNLDKLYGSSWNTAVRQKGGWAFYAYGSVGDAKRFWTFINDQAANCWQGDKKKGMTWAKLGAPPTAINGVVCGNSGNPYVGDTLCTESRPIMCLNPEGSWRENYKVPTRDAEYYYGWSGGHVKFTSAVAGTSLKSLANANGLCASQFGAGYRMAEFHDGQYVPGMGTDAYFGNSWASATKYSGGAGFFAYGTVPSGRFWTYINDQKANCWDN